MNFKLAICIFLFTLLVYGVVASDDPNDFTFTQLKYRSEKWDTHPDAWSEIEYFLASTTSIKTTKERKVITVHDKALFKSPFLYMSGGGAFKTFSDEEINILRKYLTGGGFLFIEDSIGIKGTAFDKLIREEIKRIFPDKELKKIEKTHAIFFSFYLKPKVVGTNAISSFLEGVEHDNQIILLYSQNDIFGAWERDKLGKYLRECVPGGESQRMEAIKLTVNILMYVLTGTYKLDAVHYPFIQQKLKSEMNK